ncbi:phage tail protein [Acinetobacter baumannii]
MAAQYHSLFTTQGLALLREAIQNGTKIGITHMAYGDGNGIVPTPNADFTKLVKEVYRTPLNRLAPSDKNPNWLEADGVISSAVGGFNIREVGLYAGNVLVAYANYPPTYKPAGGEGTAQIKTIRIVLQIDNTANFELKIDASVVMATIQAVEDVKLEIYQNTISIVESTADLANLNAWDGRTVKTKSYYATNQKGAATYIYDSTKKAINNTITILNGWCLQNYQTMTTIDCFIAGFKADASDETAKAHQCYELGLLVYIPDQVTIAISVDSALETKWAFGLGRIKWLNFTTTTDMERIVPSCVQNYPSKTDTYQQIQYAKVSGALGGKNVGKRFECNSVKNHNYTFDSMKTLIDYGGADIIADMVAITDRPVKVYSNCTYTQTTVTCDAFKDNKDIESGDYIRAGDNLLGVVGSIDLKDGIIKLVDGWGNTSTKELNVIPTNDLPCYTPIAYRMWGRNDYVTALADNSQIYNIIGYELDIVAGHNLTDSIGFYPVAFGTSTCVSAFQVGSGTSDWWYGLRIPKVSVAGVYCEKDVPIALSHGGQSKDVTTVYSSQCNYSVRTIECNVSLYSRNAKKNHIEIENGNSSWDGAAIKFKNDFQGGKLISCVAGATEYFSIGNQGSLSQLKLDCIGISTDTWLNAISKGVVYCSQSKDMTINIDVGGLSNGQFFFVINAGVGNVIVKANGSEFSIAQGKSTQFIHVNSKLHNLS